MPIAARKWEAGIAGELLTEEICPTCQDVEYHMLGILRWKPQNGVAYGDLRCKRCLSVKLLAACIHPDSLPPRYQFFLLHDSEHEVLNPSGLVRLVPAVTLVGVRHLQQIFSDHYAPFRLTCHTIPRDLLR
jgi:hypothetical protein